MIRIATMMIGLILLAGCPLQRHHPYDEKRCEEQCMGGTICYDGVCVDEEKIPRSPDQSGKSTDAGNSVDPCAQQLSSCPVALVGNYIMPDCYASGVFVKDNYAYIACSDGGSRLHIVDIANPAEPVQVSVFSDGAQYPATDIIVASNTAYIAAEKQLWIVDVQDKGAPAHLGSLVGYQIMDLALSETNYLVFLAAMTSLEIVDVSNPRGPQVVGSLPGFSGATSIALYDQFAYVADHKADQIKVIDISIPASPKQINQLSAPGIQGLDSDPVLVIPFLFAAGSWLRIFDLRADASNPTLHGEVTFNAPNSTKVGGRMIDIRDQESFIVGPNNTLRVVSFMDPTAPSLQMTYTFNDSMSAVKGVFTNLTHLFVAQDKAGLQILKLYPYM